MLWGRWEVWAWGETWLRVCEQLSVSRQQDTPSRSSPSHGLLPLTEKCPLPPSSSYLCIIVHKSHHIGNEWDRTHITETDVSRSKQVVRIFCFCWEKFLEQQPHRGEPCRALSTDCSEGTRAMWSSSSKVIVLNQISIFVFLSNTQNLDSILRANCLV